MTLWTSDQAVAATGGTTTQDWVAHGVSIDTRIIQPGDLFVALKSQRDGHDYVANALQAGAAAAVVTHRPNDVAEDAPLLIVSDVLDGLVALGQAARDRTDAKILAITGSVGKTSTKEMLRTVLERQGRTHASVASYNNHWGVPLTLARMPADTEFGVFEVGMNHPGEIGPLSEQVRPHVGMITTIAEAHMAAFESLAGIAREKGDIVSGLQPGGAAVLPADVDTIDILVEKARAAGATILGFGEKAEAFKLIEAKLSDDATIVRMSMRSQPAMFKLSTPGKHFAANALGVLAAIEALGGDPGKAAIDLALWSPPGGRGKSQDVILDPATDAKFRLIDDAYNANPTSMGASLEILAASTPDGKGRRIAILGDMLELGQQEQSLHAGMAGHPAMSGVDTVLCVGPRMKALFDVLPADQKGAWADKAEDLIPQLANFVRSSDIILVKGSLGSYVSRVAAALKKLGER